MLQPIYNRKTGNMSSRIIASQDVNELPPIVVILGECTPIKSVSDLEENRFKGKHVSGLALTTKLGI